MELPDDLKAIVSQVNQAEVLRAYDELIRLDLEAIAKFEDYGTKVMRVPTGIEDDYLEVAREFYAEMAAEDEFRARALDSYWSWQDKVSAVWARL